MAAASSFAGATRAATAKLVVYDGSLPSSQVLGATLAARQFGVRASQTVAQARSLCGELEVHELSEAHRQAARRLVRRGVVVFPSIGVGTVTCCAALVTWPSCSPTKSFWAKALLAQAESVRLHGRVAIASQAATAKLIARARADVTVVAPGDEKLYLRPLPLCVLPMSASQRYFFVALWTADGGGLWRCRGRNCRRGLGKDGVALHRLAAGKMTRRSSRRRRRQKFVNRWIWTSPKRTWSRCCFLCAV